MSGFEALYFNVLMDFSLGWAKKSKEGALLIALKLRQYACIMETAVEKIGAGCQCRSSRVCPDFVLHPEFVLHLSSLCLEYVLVH